MGAAAGTTSPRAASAPDSFLGYLEKLGEDELTALLNLRQDVLIDPPRGIGELTRRLGAVDSLIAAMRGMHHDAMLLCDAIMMLGPPASLARVARLLGGSDSEVRAALRPLRERGLAWESGGSVRVFEPFRRLWDEQIALWSPIAALVSDARAEDLRRAVRGLAPDLRIAAGRGRGGQRAGAQLCDLMADPDRLVTALDRLPDSARGLLVEIVQDPSIVDDPVDLTDLEGLTDLADLTDLIGLAVDHAHREPVPGDDDLSRFERTLNDLAEFRRAGFDVGGAGEVRRAGHGGRVGGVPVVSPGPHEAHTHAAPGTHAAHGTHAARSGGGDGRPDGGSGALRPDVPGDLQVLVDSGLLLPVDDGLEVPREVVTALWSTDTAVRLTGPPELRVAGTDRADPAVGGAAQAAAGHALRSVAALLDEAAVAPLPALKKGGIGARERSRLARLLAVPEAELPLWIDLAYAAGLLAREAGGYVPTAEHDHWRAADVGRRWALLALAWFLLEHSPTHREIDGGKELAPPLPLASGAGRIRRALLTAALAEGGPSEPASVADTLAADTPVAPSTDTPVALPAVAVSVADAQAHISWFVPMHGYDEAQLANKCEAAAREARLIGIVASDVVSQLGVALLRAVVAAPWNLVEAAQSPEYSGRAPFPEGFLVADLAPVVEELARQCAPLLPADASTVILQSDLTATVAGQPNRRISRLLAAAADAQARGVAGTWRFTPSSVLGAFDAGWTAEELRTELRAVALHGVPQALEYLVADVARRHGHIRTRAVRCCVVADEPTISELLVTRSLERLGLRRLAPTVAACGTDAQTLAELLRAAGMAPIVEDENGAVVVRRRGADGPPGRAGSLGGAESAASGVPRAGGTARVLPADLARLIVANRSRTGALSRGEPRVVRQLGRLNPRLSIDELHLIAAALQHGETVTITYRDRAERRTSRRIAPVELVGGILDSWCHLRESQREFSVARIEEVAAG